MILDGRVAPLTFRDLEYLIAIAEHGSFRKAAEACSVTQPALSIQVKKTEKLLSLRIFERNRRQVLPTQAGQRLIEQARKVLNEANRLIQMTESTHQPLHGPFRLGIIATLGPFLVPYFLPRLRNQFPHIELLLTENLTENLLEALQKGKLDAVLLSPPIEDSGIQELPLFEEEFVAALPADHPLATETHIKLDQLKQENFILLEEGHCLRDQVHQFCQDVLIRYSKFQATNVNTLRYMIASGIGASILPWLSTQNNPPLQESICHRPISPTPPSRTISLCWRNQYTRTDHIEAFTKVLHQSLPTDVSELRIYPHLPPNEDKPSQK